jgi:predicted XRE-type DNA-binding protein
MEINMITPKLNKQSSPRLNAVRAAAIKHLWINTPLNQAQIAAELGGMNQGRISDVLNERRFANVVPSMEL